MKTLIIEDIRSETPVEIARLGEDGTYLIGREAPASIIVPSPAVSRRHAVIGILGSQWVIRDQGSTNGSWVNAQALRRGGSRVLRSGDIVQIADVMLRIVEINEMSAAERAALPKYGVRSLLVSFAGNFLREFPVPEYGKALVIGGPHADLEISGALKSTPTVIIERKGMDTTVQRLNKESVVSLGDESLHDHAVIHDGDEILVEGYEILFNDPTNSSVGGDGSDSAGRWVAPTWGNEGESEPRGGAGPSGKPIQQGPKSGVFGRPVDDTDFDGGTVALSPEEVAKLMQGRGDGSGTRRMAAFEEEDSPKSLDSFEDKVVVIVGFGLLIALMVLLLVWLFL